MERLAMFGGAPVVPRDAGHVEWPLVSKADREAVARVFASGKFTSTTQGEQEVRGLEREWARFVGVPYCVAVSTGTAALALCLGALGVRPGDEVLVPSLSFIATALAPMHHRAVPVFVDIDPQTFNMDVARIEERITSRTRAIVPVHLHGLPADMAEINAIARRHQLVVVEDAAQAHGARYRGQMTGSLGDIAGFSLNVAKNLPTCGEGGLVTTRRADLCERIVMMRQFGEVINDAEERTYISRVLGWNYKINAVQAAFTRSQLGRFPEYDRLRHANVTRFLAALAELPGIAAPHVPPDRTHAWHILRVRLDPKAAGLDDVSPGAFRRAVRRALRAEGVPVSQYQLVPLPAQDVFQSGEGFGGGDPWAMPGPRDQRYRLEEYPTTAAVIEDSLTLQKRHLNPTAGPLLDRYAEGFHKAWRHLGAIAKIARSMPQPPVSRLSPAAP